MNGIIQQVYRKVIRKLFSAIFTDVITRTSIKKNNNKQPAES